MITPARRAKHRLKKLPGLLRTVSAVRRLRFAAFCAMYDARFRSDRLRRTRQIDAYLRRHSVRKLQLGTGSNPLESWLNTDVCDFKRSGHVVYLDAREPFPFPDCSFDFVFSEHMIEHLAYADGLRCLRECRRVLRPGGRIRVATPSLARLIGLYEQDLTDLQRRYMRWTLETWLDEARPCLPGFVLNNFFRAWDHQFIYDEETLQHALEAARFVDVEECFVGHSGAPELVGLEGHMRSAAEFNELETMVFEARRPGVDLEAASLTAPARRQEEVGPSG
jgi:predicted SAM-dependent methyltransferase